MHVVILASPVPAGQVYPDSELFTDNEVPEALRGFSGHEIGPDMIAAARAARRRPASERTAFPAYAILAIRDGLS